MVMDAIDAYFVARLPEVAPLQAAKAEAATQPHLSDFLIEEAKLRGIDPEDLRDMILSYSRQRTDSILSVELERQKAKALARQATSEQVLKSLLMTYSAS